MKVHLVDGTFELFRAYYGRSRRAGADERSGTDGHAAVDGLVRSMLALLREPEVTHIAVAFDTKIESFRNALYPGYKTGEGIEPALLAQFGPAEAACRALGLVTWSMLEFEADDALASAAARFSATREVEQVVLCSPDKDLAQSVQGERIVCLDRMRRRWLDEAGVKAKFGVAPKSIPDWLALVGDQSDGFPGVPRWGSKSSATLLAAYERLERIPDDEADWSVKVRGAASLADSLRAHRADAYLFRRLATLRLDVPIEESLEALRWHGPNAAATKLLDTDLVARAEQLATGLR